MPRSSSQSNQIAFDFVSDQATDAKIGDNSGQSSPRATSGNLDSVVSLRDREARDPIYAEASRIAGRMNAASASEKDLKELLEERKALLKKQFDGALTRQEQHKLTLVEWHLDRIEDASHGWYLDTLQGGIESYRQFGDDIHDLVEQLKRHAR